MPGPTSKLSRDLANVQADLRTGKTRAKTPRDFTPEEIRAKEALRDRLKKQMRENAAQRAIRRINEHTTTEADRVIEAQGQQINDATADSRAFFASVSGAGSSVDLRAQRAVLSVKIKEQDKKERAEKKRCEGAARPSTTTTTPTSNNNPMPAKRRRTSEQSESANRDNRDSAATAQATTPAQSPIRPIDGIEGTANSHVVEVWTASQGVKEQTIKDGYAIVICSAGRPKDLAKTLQVLMAKDANNEIRPRIYVQVDPLDPEIAEYEQVTAQKKVCLVTGVPGLPGQRNQAWLNHNFSHTLFVDDDLVRIVWPFGNLHHLASTLRQGMLDAGCHLGGISASQRPKVEPGPQPQLSENIGLVSGYFYMQSREDRIDLPLSDAQNGIGEDVERTVRYFAHSGITRIMNCAATAKNALSKSGQQQAGGISIHVKRDTRSEKQIALVHALLEQFPGLLKPALEKPNRCEFNWRAAGQKRARASIS